MTALLLAGDVMTGRGIDQILPCPADPALHEPAVDDARDYVRFAEERAGPLPRAVAPAYVWGDALPEILRADVAARIVNLETSVTARGAPWPGKEVHYRMHPANLPCLAAARIDACALANNHVLDWGTAGLLDTLEALDAAGFLHAGAGRSPAEAAAPAVLDLASGGRLLLLSAGSRTAGIPSAWAAAEGRPGLQMIEDLPAGRIRDLLREIRRPGDLVVLSVHWGGNWGYRIPLPQRDLAQRWIEEGVDVVHGHSSHHVKGVEVYRERLILYGCGDLLNDYEGIPGCEEFRPDLGLLYVPALADTGRLLGLRMTPTQIRRLQVTRASEADARRLETILRRECGRLGTGVARGSDGSLLLRWS